jgi:tetratricopeptide (TPR) repeat protein
MGGNALLQMNRHQRRADKANKASQASANSDRAAFLILEGQPDLALAACESAISLDPKLVNAYVNKGMALLALQRFSDAIACFDQAVECSPAYAEGHANRAVALLALHRHQEALDSNDRAIFFKPSMGRKLKYDQSLIRLMTGDMESGWALLESRWSGVRRSFAQPLWLGDSSISGKTILLHHEQGLGDTIQMSRYVPMVAELGARVVLAVQAPLVALLSTLPGVSQCVAGDENIPYFDVYCPLLSLPLAFKTRIDTIPASVPYLFAAARAEPSTPTQQKLKIGICWSGNPIHPNDHNRSISLAAFAPVFDLPATFVSLQKDVRATDEQVLLGLEKQQLLQIPLLPDFGRTAEIISTVDMVITVDSSVAHLAGALGKPVWILLPYVPVWRWLMSREDSPWYPTARLFRQNESREWHSVISQVCEEVRRAITVGSYCSLPAPSHNAPATF